MKKDSLIKIGYVMKTHGLMGEITLKLFPDSPEIEPKSVLMLELETGHVPYFVEQSSYKGNQVFVKLEDVNSIEQSEQLKGRSVFIDKGNRPRLKRGEFYDDELVGMEVWDGESSLGTVGQVINQGITRFLEVGERGVLIPLNGPFVTSISKTKKKIEVELPDGFLDI